MANACIFDIIISKLGYKKESGLIILFEINKNSEIGLYSTILPLYLAVCLRVKNSGKLLFNAKKITEQ